MSDQAHAGTAKDQDSTQQLTHAWSAQSRTGGMAMGAPSPGVKLTGPVTWAKLGMGELLGQKFNLPFQPAAAVLPMCGCRVCASVRAFALHCLNMHAKPSTTL